MDCLNHCLLLEHTEAGSFLVACSIVWFLKATWNDIEIPQTSMSHVASTNLPPIGHCQCAAHTWPVGLSGSKTLLLEKWSNHLRRSHWLKNIAMCSCSLRSPYLRYKRPSQEVQILAKRHSTKLFGVRLLETESGSFAVALRRCGVGKLFFFGGAFQ